MHNPLYEGATPEQLQHPKVRELLAIHNMFRNELSAVLNFVNELIAGEKELSGAETNVRIRALTRVGMQYNQHLHMHHRLESSVLFPALRKQGLDSAIIERLDSDHTEMSVMIDKFDAAIRDFATIEPGVLDNDLHRLADALHAHLAYEEKHVCPLLARFSGFPVQSV